MLIERRHRRWKWLCLKILAFLAVANWAITGLTQVQEEDRQFWAFRRPVAAPMPETRASHRVRTPIDAFVLARLEANALTLSPEAPKATLLRRAYLDLVGLPPEPDEVRAFLADSAADAYERLIDRLLDSPEYEERWARHWLDVAGYTDAPHCDTVGNLLPIDDWRYRDYVVRSFNQDKPYDRFLTEQLAGDELVDWRNASKFTPEVLDSLIATGYLRLTPDWTHQETVEMQSLIGYSDTLSRVVDSVSTGLMGLTMGCVRCHSHKFDPIPHEDYYRMMAVFATAYNPDQWLRPADRYLPAIAPPEKEQIDRHNAQIDARLAEITKRLDEWRRGPHYQQIFAAKLTKLPEPLRADVEKAIAAPAAMRNEIQRYLAEKFEADLKVSDQELSNASSEAERTEITKLGSELGSLASQKRSFEKIQALWDVGEPPVLHELIRGDARTPGEVVEPGFVTVLCPSGESSAVRPPEVRGASSGRRLALAQWLTNRGHPLTARVMVNRIWQHHFGKGIVATPENFGHSGATPTHPELLDWLAVDFMEHGWSVKRLHKLIMTSTTYRQSSQWLLENTGSLESPGPLENPALTRDPDNDLLWRMNLRRVEAEVIRDLVLSVSGRFDRTMSGPPVAAEQNADGLVVVSEKGPTPTSQWRRSLYVRSQRGSHASGKGFCLSFFEVFDYPEISINCTRRLNSTTPLQSLALTNSRFMQEQSRHFAQRVLRKVGDGALTDKHVEEAFLLALGRVPTSAESQFCQEYLLSQTELYESSQQSPGQAAQQSLAGLCLMVLASNEFLYIG
ncbi:MAG TPA: DUF1549 and DUF1553 domain-containing protein [Pirellulales bacterium]|nr:DUF1549 and DUF1553 domain-containing protein [Pirellulales bacterium]